MNEPDTNPETKPVLPPGEARTVATAGTTVTHERQPRSRVLRIRVTDRETGRLRVSLALPIGLVRVALRQGASLLPPGQ